jgi:hypothetical protein
MDKPILMEIHCSLLRILYKSVANEVEICLGEARQFCYTTKLKKKTPVGIHIATFLLNTDNKECNWKHVNANLKSESS